VTEAAPDSMAADADMSEPSTDMTKGAADSMPAIDMTDAAAMAEAAAMTTSATIAIRVRGNAQQRHDKCSSEYSVQDFLHFVLLQDSEQKLNEADSLTINASIAFIRTLPG
jgi:hypothetical protein